MTFADTQIALGLIKMPLDPLFVRKKNLCSACGAKGNKVKLRLAKDGFTQENYTKYKFEIWACDVCKKLEKKLYRIEGKGKSGANAGKMWGGI